MSELENNSIVILFTIISGIMSIVAAFYVDSKWAAPVFLSGFFSVAYGVGILLDSRKKKEAGEK